MTGAKLRLDTKRHFTSGGYGGSLFLNDDICLWLVDNAIDWELDCATEPVADHHEISDEACHIEFKSIEDATLFAVFWI
jgi:hypothetical protein